MSRSSKKKPFVAPKLLKRIEAMNESGKKEVLKTWSRASTIYPQMVVSLLILTLIISSFQENLLFKHYFVLFSSLYNKFI